MSRMFSLLLGTQRSSLHNIAPNIQRDDRFVVAHNHSMSGNNNSAKSAAREHFNEETNLSYTAYCHPKMWPLLGLTECRHVLVFPPYFSKNRMYRLIMSTAVPA